jgi:hypothetical protein
MRKRRCGGPRSTKYCRASLSAASTASAANVRDVIKAFWRVRHELISQVLCGLRREKTGMRVSELIELAMHRREHVGMRVAEAGNCRTTAGIDIFDAIAFEDGQVTVHVL